MIKDTCPARRKSRRSTALRVLLGATAGSAVLTFGSMLAHDNVLANTDPVIEQPSACPQVSTAESGIKDEKIQSEAQALQEIGTIAGAATVALFCVSYGVAGTRGGRN